MTTSTASAILSLMATSMIGGAVWLFGWSEPVAWCAIGIALALASVGAVAEATSGEVME